MADQLGDDGDVARRRKQRRYPERASPGSQRLVVPAAEVGGRWGREAHDLAQQGFLRAPRALRVAAGAEWGRRWWGQLGCALQGAWPRCSWAVAGRRRRSLPETRPHSAGYPWVSWMVLELAEA